MKSLYLAKLFLVLGAIISVNAAYAEEFGIRAQSFAGAFRAVASSNDIMYYNPAGILNYKKISMDLGYTVAQHQGKHIFGASIIDSSTSGWGLGFGYNVAYYPDKKITPAQLVNISTAMPLISDILYLGASFYYTYSTLSIEHRHFFNIDTGVLMKLPIGLRFAVVLDHLLERKGHEKPMGFSAAMAYLLGDVVPSVPLTIALDWVMKDVKNDADLAHNLSIGAEFVALSMFPLRIGFKTEADTSNRLFSLGVGYKKQSFSLEGVYQQHLSVGKIRHFGIAMGVQL